MCFLQSPLEDVVGAVTVTCVLAINTSRAQVFSEAILVKVNCAGCFYYFEDSILNLEKDFLFIFSERLQEVIHGSLSLQILA